MMRPEDTASTGEAIPRPSRATKKQQIIAPYLAGITNIEELAKRTHARPSYVGTVLQNAELLHCRRSQNGGPPPGVK